MKTVIQAFESERAAGRIPFSIEIFPPKGNLTLEAAKEVILGMEGAHPTFISVTCSAGGSGNGTEGLTVQVAQAVQETAHVAAVAHVTCASATRDSIDRTILELKQAGVESVLALRGDLLDGQEPAAFRYAYELIPVLKDAGFCVGAAAYPEGHIDCLDASANIEHLKAKQDAGADFFVTQLCFDNAAFFKFLDDARAAGIKVPITCGIMPFLGKQQIERMVFMCGSSLPSPVIKLLAKYENDPEALREAGIEYACRQIVELGKGGADALHIYSMNHPDIACAAAKALSRAGLR